MFIVLVVSGCKSSSSENKSNCLKTAGTTVVNIDGEQKLAMMINKPEGLVSYEGPSGKISIGCAGKREPNVMYEPASGPYSVIIDNNGDGFPDIGVLRETGARVKFTVKERQQ